MTMLSYDHEERAGRLRGFGEATSAATVRVITFDRAQRWRRAGLGLASWWSVALACAFIPVAHFVLVPGFAAFGVWSFARRARTGIVGLSAAGTCPDCGTEQEFELPGRWMDPLSVACASCRRTLRLSAGPAPPD